MYVIDFLKFASMLVIFGTLWRLLTTKYADTSIGRAMAVIY